MNLVDANMPRALLLAETLVTRLEKVGQAGLWAGWRPEQGLLGTRPLDSLLRYAHPNDNRLNYAVLFFRKPQLVDLKEIEWGDPIVVESDVIERYTDTIKNPSKATYQETVAHTFSKTRTLQQAIKIGAEVAVKATVGASYAGVNAGVEVSAKISAEYSRQWGETTEQTDSIDRTITVPPETDLVYEVTRSVDKMQRTIKARTDFEYDISFVSGPNVPPENHPALECNWSSWAEFLSVAKREAAADKALYELFQQDEMFPNDITELEKPSAQVVEFVASYDNVTHQDIVIR